MPKVKKIDKVNAKCIFLMKSSINDSTVYAGVLTDDFSYSTFEFSCLRRGLSIQLCSRLSECFSSLSLLKSTDIMLTDTISKDDPIYIFLKSIQSQVQFSIRFVNVLQIPKRIATYHTGYLRHKDLQKMTLGDINQLWTKILENNDCPWITKSIDSSLGMTSDIFKRRQKTLRLAMYYMLIKKHFYTKLQNSRGYQAKKKQTL